jgi:hypothetical protein
VKGFLHLVELEGLDDRFDLFHLAVSLAPQPDTANAARKCVCHLLSRIKNRANGVFCHLGELGGREKGGIATFGNIAVAQRYELFANFAGSMPIFSAALPYF